MGEFRLPVLALGPMAGVTDLAFRTLCREFGAGYTVTEMVSAKALMFRDKKTAALMKLGAEEHPAGVQLFGSDPGCMGEAAARVWELAHPQVIDINMGCPVGKVVSSGDGCALMKNPALAEEIIRAVVRVSPVPVSVKFRKGFDNGSVNAVPFAQMCEGAGASFLAVHGRTRSQMYAGRADRDSIKAVKAAVRIPVYANGDVFSAEDAVRLLRYTGADGVMIARGAMGAPWLFREAKAALAGEPIPAPPSYEERLRLAKRQFALAAADRGEKVACLEARKHLAWYLRGMPHAAFFREKVMSVSTLADIDAVSREIEDALRGERRRGHDT